MRGWLKEKRTEKGLTMAAVAEKLNITEAYYSLIERGERQQKMDVLLAIKLAEVFDLSVEKVVEMEASK